MDISKEQFMEWVNHPVTKEVVKEITSAKTRLIDNLSTGVTIGQSADVTHGLTNKMIGQIDGLSQLLKITYDDVPETNNN